MTRKDLISCDFHSVFDNTSDQHGQMLHRIDEETCAAEQPQRRALRAEQLSKIAAPRNTGRRFHDSEVIYGNVQPANVCQGCFTRNKFCDFQSRGPRARVRKCVACADSHCTCIMTTKEGAVRDPNGNLRVCQTFKCYFRQYRLAMRILKNPYRFRGTENGQGKLREAQRIVRKFHPVNVQDLQKYVLVCPRRSGEAPTDAPADLSVRGRSQPFTAPESGTNTDRPTNTTESGKHSVGDDNDPVHIYGNDLSKRQATNEGSSVPRPPPYLLLPNAR
ncbi:hypothetical protein BJV82DRAFT_601703 [Fennellomyces sp. T-0311]|nr:hypothetical protein BJV82DRAFT_601703 [Fennellomyces sp. T-0311]